jgi:Holliday junction resolvase RusA-like endonuclease
VASPGNEPKTIELPLPHLQSANSRSHWRSRCKNAAADRFLAAITARQAGATTPLPGASVRIDWFCPTRRLLDCDNALARCKAYLDGLTDASWWKDDRAIRQVTIQVHPPGEKRGVVVIAATPLVD